MYTEQLSSTRCQRVGLLWSQAAEGWRGGWGRPIEGRGRYEVLRTSGAKLRNRKVDVPTDTAILTSKTVNLSANKAFNKARMVVAY